MVDFTLFYGGFKNRTLVRWDADGDWEALDTEIDHAEGVATATVTEFSTVALVDDPDGGWSPTTQQRIQPEWPTLETFDDGDGWITAGDGEVEIGDGTASLETEWEAPDDDDDSGSTPPPGDGDDGDDDDSDESDDDSGDGDDSDESDDDSGTDCPGDDDSSSGDPGGDVNTVSDEEYDTEGMPNGDSGGTGDGCPDDDDSSSGDPGGDVNTVSDDEYDTEGMPNGDSGGTGDDDEDDEDDDKIVCPSELPHPGWGGSCPGDDDDDDGDDRGDSGDGSDPSPSPDPEPTEAELSRGISLDGAETVTMEVFARATTEGDGDQAEIRLEGDGGPIEVLSVEGGDDTNGWVTREVDVATVDGAATLYLETEGAATLEVDYISILKDESGSGLPDVAEKMDLGMPSGIDVVGEPLNLDPEKADTSGDGLRDGEEVDIDVTIEKKNDEWTLQGRAVEARSHPARVNTSGGSLNDTEDPNPLVNEHMVVRMGLPTVIEGKSEEGVEFDTYDDMYKLIHESHHNERGFTITPEWMPSSYDADPDKWYIKVSLTVEADIKHASKDDLPEEYKIDIDGRNAEIIDGSEGDLQLGSQEVTLVIETDDPHDGISGYWASIGHVEFTADMPDNSILTRSDSEINLRTDEEYSYNLGFEDEFLPYYQHAMETWKRGC